LTVVDDVRAACARVAARARLVRVDEDAIGPYAAALPVPAEVPGLDPDAHVVAGPVAERIAFVMTLDAINFGSGWFPTIRKRDGKSGYFTVAHGVRDRFRSRGPWSPAELAEIDAAEVAAALGQDPDHALMALFARSLRDLGARVGERGGFPAVVDAAGGSAVALVEELAGWECFADVSQYDGERVPFFKRAQITPSDLAYADAAAFDDLHRLTLFADNLIPHVLRLDGVLCFDAAVAARIERGELLQHDSPEEIEMRAGAVHAAELICRERPDLTPREVDQVLWTKGGGARYKAVPRPRSRTTAY
jgi:Potential Queuosine, Q, salvage protein family